MIYGIINVITFSFSHIFCPIPPQLEVITNRKTFFIPKVRDLGHAVNATKRMIDDTRLSLDAKQKDRMEQGKVIFELMRV